MPATKTPDHVIKLIEKAAAEKATFIDLGNCGLTAVPEEITECAAHLKEIKFGSGYYKEDKWTMTSNSFGINDFAGNTKSFDILQQIPELSALYFYACSIGDAGAKILSTLKRLTFLDVGDNEIGEVGAKSISTLASLTSLSIYSNNIGEAGIKSLSALAGLTSLIIFDNRIDDAGAKSISTLTGLTSLHISINNIGDRGAKSISTLTGLISLAISENKIGDAGAKSISALARLTSLDISNNKIGEAGAKSISSLAGLTSLVIGANHIGDEGAQSISALARLTYLDIGGNQIDDAGARSINALAELDSLDISYNFIGNSGAQNISAFARLTSLNISGNYISNAGAMAIANLNLSNLNISNNQITDLSPFLKMLKMGNELVINDEYTLGYNQLNITGNPVTTPPLEVWKQGREAVLEYFRLIEKEGGSENIYEAKLTLVGEGGSGKTSLQLRLLDQTAPLPNAETHTRGVEITDWDISGSKDKKEIIHIWDFGGQDMYFPVHRFFLTENCVYVLMASSRHKAHNFQYWIPSIYQFGGESPILVAQTCHNGHHAPWLADLKPFLETTDFNIVSVTKDKYFRLNLINDNEGLDEIKSAITGQVKNLFLAGKAVPPSFIKLRNALLNEMHVRPCISFEEYEKFCTSVDETFANQDTLKLFTGTMHRIGALLWYQHNAELAGWVILNPEWAMKAVYALIDDKVIENKNGHIKPEDFERLWKDETYKHRHSVLRKMLEVFKIAFPKKHIRTDFILPARQLNVPAESNWPLTDGSLRLWVKFAFMPKGIINQVSADLSDYILNDADVWNNGVILKDELNKTECLLVENIFEKKINITARGKDARTFYQLAIRSIKNIVSDYRGVSYEIEVPCKCNVCAVAEKPFTYKYSRLNEWWSDKPNKKLVCNESEEEYTVDELLRYTGLQTNPHEEPRKNEPKKPSVKIFISYAHKYFDYFKIFNDTLRDNLKVIRNYSVEIFEDTKIMSGEKWDETIKQKIMNCDCAILLVSDAFLASDYTMKNEIEPLIAQMEKKGTALLPVHFYPGNFSQFESLSQLQFFKKNGRDYQKPEKGDKFCFADLIKFRETDGELIPNPEISRYIQDFANELIAGIDKKRAGRE